MLADYASAEGYLPTALATESVVAEPLAMNAA
jgi:hypothetical protein